MANAVYQCRAWQDAKAAVLNRDRWVCQLCRQSIDEHARPGSDGAGTADHIVPVSAGGAWWDLDNLRAAHIACNRRRGDGRGRAIVVYPTRPSW